MTQIVWDKMGERFYENGASRGVFYTDESVGLPWNGLTSVETKSVDTATPIYVDGLKYGDLITLGDFEGVLSAFTYPDEFLEYEGTVETKPGVSLTSQPKRRFSVCYRTEINNDLGTSIGYKLHILYNLIAIPTDKEYETLSLDNEPMEFQWNITAIPEEVDNYRPTAYIVIDSRKTDPFMLIDLEGILYGDEDREASLPNLNALVSYIMNWGRFIVVDHGDGTWTATTPLDGIITMLDPDTFEIDVETAIYLDPVSYTLSSSDDVVP